MEVYRGMWSYARCNPTTLSGYRADDKDTEQDEKHNSKTNIYKIL